MSSPVLIGGAESLPQHRPLPNNNGSQSSTVINEIASHASTRTSNGQSIPSLQELRTLQQSGATIPISDQQLVNAIERAIKAVQGPTTSLDFSVHQTTKQIMVKVLDKETGEVIREIPPEKNLDLLAKLWEMAGILVDEKR